MIGIIDVGGGLRGIYGAGIFDFCLDNNIKFDYCIGVSAGSGNVASYIGKQKGRNYQFYLQYTFRKQYMSMHNMLHNGSYIDLDYIYGNLSNSDGENPLNYDEIKNSDIIMKVVATNALTGKAIYFDKNDLFKNNYSILKASCCIPVVCKPYFINDIPYYDGGISDPVPIEKAFEDGCDKVILILTNPINSIKNTKKYNLLAKLISTKYPNASQSFFESTMKYYNSVELAKKYSLENKVLIISPDDCCGLSTLNKNAEGMKKLYFKGYNDAKSILDFLQINNLKININ